MVALAIVIAQIVRHRIEVLYPTTLLIRLVLIGTIVALYGESGDRLFLVLTAIVGVGMLLTTAALLSDPRARWATGCAGSGALSRPPSSAIRLGRARERYRRNPNEPDGGPPAS